MIDTRFIIRQKILALRDGFTIKDEAEIDQYRVKSKLLSFGKKLWIYDMFDNELCTIEQRVFKLLPEYHISIAENEVMTIKKVFTLFNKRFDITGSAGDYTVEGDIIAKDFQIIKNGCTAATISKKLLAMSDTYSVDISENENPVLMLAVAVVMDLVCHDRN